MHAHRVRLLGPLLLVSLFGAGCLSDLVSPKTAQPFSPDQTDGRVAEKLGFGTLPAIPVPPSNARVTLENDPPPVPQNVTVLRLTSGAPNESQLLNMASALGVPGGSLGSGLPDRNAVLSWTDSMGIQWRYDANGRELSFADPKAAGMKSVSELPAADIAIQTANAFLRSRSIRLDSYREPLLEPDWTLWWQTERARGRCMDSAAIRNISLESEKEFPSPANIGVLPGATTIACQSPVLPSRMTIRYHMLIDGRDVIRGDGSYVAGAEVAVYAPTRNVASGAIRLPADPERSDYPALPVAAVRDLLEKGGLSGASGTIRVSTYEFASYLLQDGDKTFLIPSLVGIGVRTRPDGGTEDFRIVVPLLAR